MKPKEVQMLVTHLMGRYARETELTHNEYMGAIKFCNWLMAQLISGLTLHQLFFGEGEQPLYDRPTTDIPPDAWRYYPPPFKEKP